MGHHHGWQQEDFSWYKKNPGKGLFRSISEHYATHTHKSPLRNDFFFVYHKLGWDME